MAHAMSTLLTKLFHGLQGWPPPGPNRFHWNDGQLAYRVPTRSLNYQDGNRVIVPTLDQRQGFWNICDEIDVWSWPPVFGRTSIIDGLMYSLELEVGNRIVKSEGQACESPGFTSKLLRLHRALQAMAGYIPPDVLSAPGNKKP